MSHDPQQQQLIDFAAGLACGLLFGAAAGLLFAPATGEDTRHWIADRSRAVGRRGAALLHPQEALRIIRSRGIVGLADEMERADSPR